MVAFNKLKVATAVILATLATWAVTEMPLEECREKAAAGDAEAQYQLGQRYEEGHDVSKNGVRAIVQYKKAAEQKHRKACARLAELYSCGEYVRKDAALAAKYRVMAGDEAASGGRESVRTTEPAAGRDDKSTSGGKKFPPNDKLYCIVDLSPGPNAKKYSVSYRSSVPVGGWTDLCKTSRLVLRRIDPGTFIMGENQKDESHRVTLTKPFYIGVFEVTQKQYELVTGGNPSKHKGPMRPVTDISISQLRGSCIEYDWPTSRKVAPNSFMGYIRKRTGLDGFELPTEAQWEYACRAGTTTLRYDGSDTNDFEGWMKLGRLTYNQKARGWQESTADFKKHKPDGKGGYMERHTSVGMYKPNAWGLYDMYGNVWELCVSRKYETFGRDPLGKLNGPKDYRPRRGNSWNTGMNYRPSASYFTSFQALPWDRWDDTGFRLVLNVDEGSNGVKDKGNNGITKSVRPDGLIHRWSFNGNLKDSVGNCDGKTVGGNVTFGYGRVRIRPGGGYVDLGANVLPGGRNNEYTIEIWATKYSVQNWARVFHIPDNWHPNDYFWTWDKDSNPKKWRVKLAGCTRWDVSPVDGTRIGVENHFVVVYGLDEKRRPYYQLCALRGGKQVYFLRRVGLLGEMFHSHSAFFLGHSFPSDKNTVTADASYNEVRIWNRALTHDEIMRSARLGPDKLP